MKLKRVLAGFLAGALVVTGIPVSRLGVISAEAAVQTDIEANLQYRTRPIAEVEVSTDIGAEYEDDVHPFSNLTLRSGFAKSKEMSSVDGKHLYFSLESSKLLRSVKFFASGAGGDIKKCTIEVSNVDTDAPDEIDESGWMQVYASGDDEWFHEAGSSKGAYFNNAQRARHVRITVQETWGTGEDGATDANKYIAGARMMIYEAGRKDQVEYSGDIALREENGGKVTVKACTSGNVQNTINGVGNVDSSSDSEYWNSGVAVSDTKVNYIIYDLHDLETTVSEINLRWNAKAWANKYKLETSDTCTLANNGVPGGADISTLNNSGDWETVVDFSTDETRADQPLDTFTPDHETMPLQLTKLKRYVRLVITGANPAARMKGGALREIEIIANKYKAAVAENVALGMDAEYEDGRKGSTIVAGYSGDQVVGDTTYSVENVLAGHADVGEGTDEETDDNYWMPLEVGEDSNKGIDMSSGNKAYLVLDLGMGTVTDVESMELDWHGLNSANECKVYTADEFTLPENADGNKWEVVGENVLDMSEWTQVAMATDDDPTVTYKRTVFGNYTTHQLQRYVCFEMSDLNENAVDDLVGTKNAAVRAVKIMGIRKTEEADDIRLTVDKPTKGATTASAQAYANVSDGAGYDVAETKWYETSNMNTPLADDAKFEVGKAYTVKVKVSSSNKFADLTSAVINGDTNDLPTVSAPENYNGTGADKLSYITVQKHFGTVASPVEPYNNLKAAVQTGDNAARMAEVAALGADQTTYTKRSWKSFKEAYDAAVKLVGAYTEEAPAAEGEDGTEEFLYEPAEVYEEALNTLLEEFEENGQKGLKARELRAEIDLSGSGMTMPEARITRTDSEQKVVMGVETGISTGDVQRDDVKFTYLDDFDVLSDESFKGRVKAPEETVEGKTVNSVFNMGQPSSDDWTKAFIMRFTLGLPRTIDKKQTIIGVLNGQWGVQLMTDKSLVFFGQYASNSWPEVKVNVSEYLGNDIEVALVYVNGKISAYVEGAVSGETKGRKPHSDRNLTGKFVNSKDVGNGSATNPAYPMFNIGYNESMWELGDSKTPSHRENEAYQGTMKDFRMYSYTVKDGEGSWIPADYESQIKPSDSSFANNVWTDTSATLMSKFDTYLENKTPTIELKGIYAPYNVRSCKWLNKTTGDPVENPSPYEDYTMEIAIQTNEMATGDGTNGKEYVFPANVTSENFLYVPGEDGNWVKVDNSLITNATLDDTDSVLTYTYQSEGLENPKDALETYLTSNPKETNDKGDGTRKYTRQSWQTYSNAYDTAQALVQSSASLKRKPQVYRTALENLQNATLVERTADTCECAIGSIIYTGPTSIDMAKPEGAEAETGSLDLSGYVKVTHDRYDCPKHTTDSAVTVTYAKGTDNAGAAITQEGALTVTKAGTVQISLGATFNELPAAAKEITFTAISDEEKRVAKEEAQAAWETAKELKNKGNASNIYTSESWTAFIDAYNDAEADVSSNQMDTMTLEQLQGVKKKFDDAVNLLVEQELADAISEAQTALSGAVENNDEGKYTAESWAAYEQAKEDLREELTKEKPDKEVLKTLTAKLDISNLKPVPTEDEKNLEAAKDNAQTALNNAVKDSESSKYSNWDGYAALKAQLTAALQNPNVTASELNDLISRLNAYKLVPKSGNVTPDPGPNPGPGPAPRPNPAPVENFVNVKNVRYELDKKNPKAAVAVKILKDAKSVTIQKTVKINGKSYKVEKIGASAFKGLKKLTSVTVGVNVKTIEKQAFMNCKKLKKVTLSNGKALKTIGSKAFKGTKKGLTVKAKKLKKAKDRKALLKKVKKAGAKSAKVTK